MRTSPLDQTANVAKPIQSVDRFQEPFGLIDGQNALGTVLEFLGHGLTAEGVSGTPR